MYNSFRTQKHWRVSTKSDASTQLKHKQSFEFFKTCLHSCFFNADNNSLLKDKRLHLLLFHLLIAMNMISLLSILRNILCSNVLISKMVRECYIYILC